MTLFPYSVMALPENCLLEKRVYKKLFYDNTDLTVTDKKWFTRDIDSIIWMYTLKPHLTQIREYIEEEFSYDEIAIIDLAVITFDHVERLSDTIHRAIPYALLIVFRAEGGIRLSIADKRYSKTDVQAATINKLWMTDSIYQDSLGEIEDRFIKELKYTRQPHLHLKAFYQRWISVFLAYEAGRISGKFNVITNKELYQQQKGTLEDYHQVELRINEMKSAIQKESSFSKQVELNQEIKELESKLSELAGQL